MFALIDCTNFYASCHAIFEPRLWDMNYVIAGSNDGCVIARSEGARKLGIKMGVPWFQIKDLQEQHDLYCLSANFSLYGALSTRVHGIISGLTEDYEWYSIDEAFLRLNGYPGSQAERVQRVRDRILQWTGVPTGAGLGATKTIAKLGSHISKAAWRKPGSYPAEFSGLCDLTSVSSGVLENFMARTSVTDVWGVGPKFGKRLAEFGVQTALDLARMDTRLARQQFGVVLERTIRELNGISCIDLESQPQPRQQMACTRSLGKPVCVRDELMDIGGSFAEHLATKIRSRESVTDKVLVFAMTSPFRPGPRFYKSMVVALPCMTSDNRIITQAAREGLAAIFAEGYKLVKVGVVLLDLCPASTAAMQAGFDFDVDAGAERAARLMKAVDAINNRFGAHAVHLAATQPHRRVQRQQNKCPDYLTSWSQVPLVRA